MVSEVPGALSPSLVLTVTAAPSVFNPNTGSDPGMSAISAIAIFGIRSHDTTSPNG